MQKIKEKQRKVKSNHFLYFLIFV